MLFAHLRSTIRGLQRQRLYGLVNIAGLAVGLTCSLLVLLYVLHESSYESFNPRRDRVFRVVRGDDIRLPAGLAQIIRQTFPEVEEVARLSFVSHPLIHRERVKRFQRVASADPGVFPILGLRFVAGDLAQMELPHRMAISAEMARLYFGEGVDPVGEVLRWDTAFDCIVAGVYELPERSHFPLHFVLSHATVDAEAVMTRVPDWGTRGVNTYVVARTGPIDDFGERLLAAVRREQQPPYRAQWAADGPPPVLQSIADIHLHSHTKDELEANGSARDVLLLAAIGVFVLLVACANFVNLSTARSVERAREVGLRKVIGATRGQLLAQFMGEAVAQVALAALLALAAAQLVLPWLSGILGMTLGLDVGTDLWLGIGAALLLTAGAGAAFPSLILSRLPPQQVFRDASSTGPLGVSIRRRLVEVQFALSILLVLATATVYLQLRLLRQTDVGFDKERVVTFRVGYQDVMENNGVLARRMAALPAVAGVTRFQEAPFLRLNGGAFWDEAGTMLTGATIPVDDRFVRVMGMRLLAGRNVRADLAPGELEVILNETAVTALGIDPQAAPGTTVGTWMGPARVAGVVADFHYESLHQAVGPVLLVSPNHPLRTAGGEPLEYYNYVGVRLRPGRLAEGIEQVRAVWDEVVPDYPLDYWFLDDAFDRQYRGEQRLMSLVGSFAALAVVVAALGTYALAASTARRRTKEIGIRKALGATARSILLMFTRDFGRLLVVGGLLAALPGFWAMQRWLETYVCRVDAGVTVLATAVAAVGATAAAAVGWEVSRAARMNPVDALRHE